MEDADDAVGDADNAVEDADADEGLDDDNDNESPVDELLLVAL